jgi:hypothetical protein
MSGAFHFLFLVLLAVTPAATAKAETPAERTARFVNDFDPGGGIALTPMIEHRDQALIRRLVFARDPYFAKAWRLSGDDVLRTGPDRVTVARVRLAPGERERLFIMVTTVGACGARFCTADFYVSKGGRWVRDFSVSGDGALGKGWVWTLTVPIVGRFFDHKAEKYAEPTIIDPNYNNVWPIFIWRYAGIVWDGREWALFCWYACDK